MKIESRKVLSGDKSIGYTWYTRRINGTLYSFTRTPGRIIISRMIDGSRVHNFTF